MPNWGLSEAQRQTKPWGIDEKWLKPHKTVTDPIHGDIFLNKLEADIADSKPMQRLRGVRQLGTSHLIYPGATHSRFSHALGTLRAAQDLLDAVVAGLSGPRPTKDDLLKEWERLGNAQDAAPSTSEPSADGEQRSAASKKKLPTVFDTNLAEATVLARLGGLLHDLCHVPMGHTIEDDLKILVSHDENVERFERLWEQIPEELRKAMGQELAHQLRPLIVSKSKDPEIAVKYPFVEDIVGNTICADLMDYLRRDHHGTGLPIALGNRFVNEFYVTSGDHPVRPARMAVHIDRNGHLRHDVVTELVKYLRYRYELSERVLYHHAKVSADAMLGKLLDMWRDALWVDEAGGTYEHLFTGQEGLFSDIVQTRDRVHQGAGEAEANEIESRVVRRLEEQFLTWDDDGLLTDLRRTAERAAKDGGPAAPRWAGISLLSEMVLTRQLFKSLGRADSEADLADAKKIHEDWGSADKRRELEEGRCAVRGNQTEMEARPLGA